MKNIYLILILSLLLSGCSVFTEYTGFYYPDGTSGDKSKWQSQSGFKNIQECRDWVAEVAGDKETFDYECGKNCKSDKKLDILVCKETTK